MRRRGFTLIELLVVVAILATIAGGILVAYDGLETDAAQAQATFNIAAVDRAVRTYKTVNKVYPSDLDALLFSAAGTGADATMLVNQLNSKIKGKVGPLTLTAQAAAALNTAGIRSLRYVSGTITGQPASFVQFDNTATTGTSPQIPNRMFDNPTRGWGVSIPVAAGLVLPAIETSNNGATGGGAIQAFTAAAVPADSARLRDIAGLDQNRVHHVVALGLGNNCSMVAESTQLTGATGVLSEAPYYTNVTKTEYGRFLLLFLVASDTNDDGTIAATEHLTEAKFLACLDTKGDWLDEEFAEYTNQKP
jgi:prepilin-type N-terminal cleavage/methylation domain-containing protein